MLFSQVEHVHQVFKIGIGDRLDGSETIANQDLPMILQQTLESAQITPRPVVHLLDARLRVEIDLPAGQLRCEPNILAAPPDTKAQVVVWNDQLHASGVLVHDHLSDHRRADG